MSVALVERVNFTESAEPNTKENRIDAKDAEKVQGRSFEEVLKSESRKKTEKNENPEESEKKLGTKTVKYREKKIQAEDALQKTETAKEEAELELEPVVSLNNNENNELQPEKGEKKSSASAVIQKDEKVTITLEPVKLKTEKIEKDFIEKQVSGKTGEKSRTVQQKGRESTFNGNSPDKQNTGDQQKGKVRVFDFRAKNSEKSAREKTAGKTSEFRPENIKENANPKEINASGKEENIFQAKTQILDHSKEPVLRRSDQAQLLKNLKENVNSQIVKHADFIIKNEGSGEIRLLLKPDRLGTVRINIELQDNHIAGRIFVENNSIKEVFESNMDSLSRSFRENGFETSAFDVDVSGGKSDGEYKNGPSNLNRRNGMKMLEENVPAIRESVSSDYMIDLVV